jgi:hypothetical protein
MIWDPKRQRDLPTTECFLVTMAFLHLYMFKRHKGKTAIFPVHFVLIEQPLPWWSLVLTPWRGCYQLLDQTMENIHRCRS